MLKITIVYENHQNPNRPEMKTGHGFAAYLEFEGLKILFDTGWDAEKLLYNCHQAEIDLTDLDAIFISHAHWDHAGGLVGVLKKAKNPAIFLPQDYSISQPKEFGEYIQDPYIKRINKFEILSKISQNLASTGCFKESGPIGEQALLIRYGSNSETLLIVGCLHPGLKPFINFNRTFGRVTTLLGGIHGFNDVAYLKTTEIRNLYLGHCTQNYALFQHNHTFNTQNLTVGKVIIFD